MNIRTKLPFLLLLLFFTGELSAQVPSGFNFQAVARNDAGELMTNRDIGVRISILESSENGTAVYTETHQVITGSDGLFHLVIGQGDTQDDFNAVNWPDGTHYVRLETDPDGGTDYEELGVTQLFSVPYAMVAQNVIDGISAGEEPVTVYQLNTSEGDTSFTINTTGSESLSALRINAETEDQNIGVNTRINSRNTSGAIQVGYWANVTGDAQASHYGFIGQSNSKGRYNYGAYGSASGDGSGEIVPIGEEVDNFFGSSNIGGGFYATGNLNSNVGVEGVTHGQGGSRINIGVEGRSFATSDAENIGINGWAGNSTLVNYGASGISEGNQGRNIGVRGLAFNGVSNVGGYFHGADTSAVFHGPVTVMNSNLQVNGDITATGDISQTSDLRLKEDITLLEHGLATIMQLQPRSYRFRDNGNYSGMKLATGQRFGLIAQEVETVLPSLVDTRTHRYLEEVDADGRYGQDTGSGETVESVAMESVGPDSYSSGSTAATHTVEKTMEYKTLNYTELIPVLIKAVQEQQEEIERLREKLERMQEQK